MPKKTGEGIKYFAVATSNQGYDGDKDQILDNSNDDKTGRIIRKADPACGGYKNNYTMDDGPRYEVGTTAPSKALGILTILIFECGSNLRYSNACLITDSAYEFIEGMVILSLW